MSAQSVGVLLAPLALLQCTPSHNAHYRQVVSYSAMLVDKPTVLQRSERRTESCTIKVANRCARPICNVAHEAHNSITAVMKHQSGSTSLPRSRAAGRSTVCGSVPPEVPPTSL